MYNRNSKEGQVLLLAVMLLGTIMTIVMTVVYTSRTETQVTRLQQDADKALAAAEAGLEVAVPTVQPGPAIPFSTFVGGLSTLEGIDTQNSTVQVSTSQQGMFLSPLIARDDQYTIYLASYSNGNFSGTSTSGDKWIYFGSKSNCNAVALEFTIVYDDGPNYRVIRKAAGNMISGNTNQVIPFTPQTPSTDPFNSTFQCKTKLNLPAKGKLLFIRVYGTETLIGIADPQFPAQGKEIISEAKTTTGVVKKVKLFQSYPQLRSDLFVTSFNIP